MATNQISDNFIVVVPATIAGDEAGLSEGNATFVGRLNLVALRMGQRSFTDLRAAVRREVVGLGSQERCPREYSESIWSLEGLLASGVQGTGDHHELEPATPAKSDC